MNRCLYCYQLLRDNEIDFHPSCNFDIYHEFQSLLIYISIGPDIQSLFCDDSFHNR